MRLPVLLLLVAFATSAAAGAANLIENPRFDDDTAGWAPLLGSAIAHDDADERGSQLSGSIEVSGPTGFLIGAYQCVPVVAGTTYAFGASVRIPEGQPVSIHGSVSLGGWSSSADCNTIDLDAAIAVPLSVTLPGVWGPTQTWATAPPGAQAAYFWLQAISFGQEAQFRLSFDNVFFLEDATCGPSLTTLCLNGGRFRVIVEWETKQGEQGFGHAVDLTDDSGYFWFFDSANVELVTKLLDACPTQFHTFWFFAAGLTNVETVIRVLDTAAEVERVYVNPQETPFAPIQDTDAFETCP